MQKAFARILEEKDLVAPGDRVLVALSGGADSVALLHLLLGIADEWSLRVDAAHLDHALRPESADEADFVRRLCASLAVPLALERAAVREIAEESGGGIEEAAREARREFLLRVARKRGCRVIALGHHRGDQAETVIHRLLRGSALPGLAAIRPQNGPFIRPLLDFSRRDLRSYLAGRNLEWVEDPSNRDPVFTRNRIRHDLMPLLETFNPRIEEHLARLGARIALEEEYWRGEEDRVLENLCRFAEDGLRLQRSGLLKLHPALRLRVLRRAMAKVRGDLRGIGALHIEALERLVLGDRPQADLDLPRAWAGRRYETLWLRSGPPSARNAFDVPITGPGVYLLPRGGELRVALIPEPLGEGRCAVEFDAAQVPFPLRLRSPLPGDRFRPAGSGGSKKLKDFFIDAKLPREARRSQPLVVGDEILWVAGMRRCEGHRPAAGGKVLRLVLTAELPTNCL